MTEPTPEKKKKKMHLMERTSFMYFFLACLFFYLLLSAHFLISAGSLFIEGLAKGGYRSAADPYDNYSLWLGFLHGFASLCGVVGAVAVLSTPTKRFFKFKVLLFIPWVTWTLNQIVGNLRWGFEYWTQWLFLVPMLVLSLFLLYCVIKRVDISVLSLRPKKRAVNAPPPPYMS